MNRRVVTVAGYDILFQFRNGFYLIYLIISALYIGILFSIPESHRLLVTYALVFSDTSILGLTFVGALLLLEKQQNILSSLFVTPLHVRDYLAGKVISLSLLALWASLAILVIPNGWIDSSVFVISGILLGSSFFILLGIAVGARVSSMNGFIFGIMASTVIFALPLLGYFKVYDAWWLYLLPTRATLLLFESSLRPLSTSELVYAFATLLVWNVLGARLAVWSFHKFILER